MDHNKLLKILKEMRIPDHLTYLLRNLYAGQEATVRTGYGTTHWFQIEKGVCQGCILSPCLFNLYAEYIMRNAGLVEAQAGIKIAGRNINNLRYTDDTTLMAESEKELKSLLIKIKEEVGLWRGARRYLLLRTVPVQVWWWEVVHDWLGLHGQVRGPGRWVSEVLFWHLGWNLDRKSVTGREPRAASLVLPAQLLKPTHPPRVGMTAPGMIWS